MLLVGGDAGAGKTTLIERVLATSDAQVLRGGAHLAGTDLYGPLLSALPLLAIGAYRGDELHTTSAARPAALLNGPPRRCRSEPDHAAGSAYWRLAWIQSRTPGISIR
jgi:hypothetical protein